ncbi:DUF3905 domain-containing protein [Alicyclobacillus sp. SO9]|uniref:DUF3905 domain-containing protein n=1 Tax=Alicyclobacillus sp. SO9 TaxID=2665646 RepID=UPI0018E7A21A|nr:DUF3905 domain-containing protein [Alicyclobacillus sp. SO9]QQE77654.1 DUF3905 domain-containing protein [Alicyclobacillus sp. SO9]
MTKRDEGEQVPKWRETPLDHWSKDVDPVIMSGDEWADDDSDPGQNVFREKLEGRPPAPFMHPMHDTGYERSADTESSSGDNESRGKK